VDLVLARLPIESRVKLRVPPNKIVVPHKVLECFESPVRVNKTGAHVMNGIVRCRWGLCYLGMFFTEGDFRPMVTIGTLDNHPHYTTTKRMQSPNMQYYWPELMIEACDGYFLGPDADFVADLKLRLQAWLRLRS
jgi:hypothetical protein